MRIAGTIALIAGAQGCAVALVAGACGSDVHLGDLLVDAAAGEASGADADVRGAADATVADADASTIADADADAGGPFIGDIPGLVMWLDGDRGPSGDGGAFRWVDQSGHGNDAIAHATVPVTTAAGFNGHSAIAFNGSQHLSVPDAPTVRFSGDYAMFVVARSQAQPPLYSALIGKTAAAYPYPGPAMFVNYLVRNVQPTTSVGAQIDFTHAVISTETALSDGVTKIFEMQRQGTLLSVRVDNHPATSTTVPPVDVTAPGADMYIGGQYDTAFQALDGAIGEVVVFDGTLAPNDEALVRAYLSNKYAIPP